MTSESVNGIFLRVAEDVPVKTFHTLEWNGRSIWGFIEAMNETRPGIKYLIDDIGYDYDRDGGFIVVYYRETAE